MPRPLVFGLGLPRTGTSSLRAAMAQLGWRVQTDPFAERRLQRLFAGDVRGAVKADIAAGYTYLSEPYGAFAEQVLDAFPRVPAIITVRDQGAWKRSLRRYLEGRPPRRQRPSWAKPRRGAQRVLASLVWGGKPPLLSTSAAWWTSLALCAREQVLMLDVCAGQGWGELCPFLGWPVPGVPFPRENATEARRAVEAGG